MQSRLHSMTRFNILPLFSVCASSPITCFLISYLIGNIFYEKLHHQSFSTRCDVISVHGCHDMFTFDVTLPHTWARGPSRQLEIAECRLNLFLPTLCDVTRAEHAVLQRSAHVFVTCLVILWRQFDECSPSRWSVEVRPSHVNQCHNFSSTCTRGDLRQHYFQRLQRRRRRVQLWPRVRLEFLRDPPRAFIGLPWLSFFGLRPSCLDGCLLCLM